MTERDLEKLLIKKVKKRGGLCLKFVSPGQSGVPDRIVILPDSWIGANTPIAFVEVKKPGEGELRPLQRYWLNRLSEYGLLVYLLDSEEMLERILFDIESQNDIACRWDVRKNEI